MAPKSKMGSMEAEIVNALRNAIQKIALERNLTKIKGEEHLDLNDEITSELKNISNVLKTTMTEESFSTLFDKTIKEDEKKMRLTEEEISILGNIFRGNDIIEKNSKDTNTILSNILKNTTRLNKDSIKSVAILRKNTSLISKENLFRKSAGALKGTVNAIVSSLRLDGIVGSISDLKTSMGAAKKEQTDEVSKKYGELRGEGESPERANKILFQMGAMSGDIKKLNKITEKAEEELTKELQTRFDYLATQLITSQEKMTNKQTANQNEIKEELQILVGESLAAGIKLDTQNDLQSEFNEDENRRAGIDGDPKSKKGGIWSWLKGIFFKLVSSIISSVGIVSVLKFAAVIGVLLATMKTWVPMLKNFGSDMVKFWKVLKDIFSFWADGFAPIIEKITDGLSNAWAKLSKFVTSITDYISNSTIAKILGFDGSGPKRENTDPFSEYDYGYAVPQEISKSENDNRYTVSPQEISNSVESIKSLQKTIVTNNKITEKIISKETGGGSKVVINNSKPEGVLNSTPSDISELALTVTLNGIIN